MAYGQWSIYFKQFFDELGFHDIPFDDQLPRGKGLHGRQRALHHGRKISIFHFQGTHRLGMAARINGTCTIFDDAIPVPPACAGKASKRRRSS